VIYQSICCRLFLLAAQQVAWPHLFTAMIFVIFCPRVLKSSACQMLDFSWMRMFSMILYLISCTFRFYLYSKVDAFFDKFHYEPLPCKWCRKDVTQQKRFRLFNNQIVTFHVYIWLWFIRSSLKHRFFFLHI